MLYRGPGYPLDYTIGTLVGMYCLCVCNVYVQHAREGLDDNPVNKENEKKAEIANSLVLDC